MPHGKTDPTDRSSTSSADPATTAGDVPPSAPRRLLPAGLSAPMRFAGVGLELAASTLLVGGLGYWIDIRREHAIPYWGAVGALVGFAVGMYRLIRLANQFSRDESHSRDQHEA